MGLVIDRRLALAFPRTASAIGLALHVTRPLSDVLQHILLERRAPVLPPQRILVQQLTARERDDTLGLHHRVQAALRPCDLGSALMPVRALHKLERCLSYVC